MTASPGPHRRVEVTADLRLDLDGQPVTLRGDGSELTLQVSDPATALDQVTGALLPRTDGKDLRSLRQLGRAADALHGAGLRLTVRGPQGPLIVLGGRFRAWSQILTGSGHVALGRVRALAPVARAVVVTAVKRRTKTR